MQTNSRPITAQRDDALVSRVVRAIADEEQCDALDVPPLYETVDPEALNRLVEGTSVTEVSFSHFGYRVRIAGDDSIRVTPR